MVSVKELLKRRLSQFLIVLMLLELVAPVAAIPFWEEDVPYPQSSTSRHSRHAAGDPQLDEMVDRARGKAPELPEFHGERPMEGVDDGSPSNPPPAAPPKAPSGSEASDNRELWL